MSCTAVLAGDVVILKKGGVDRRWRIHSIPSPGSGKTVYQAFMLGREEIVRAFQPGHDELVDFSVEDITAGTIEPRRILG